ncbi:MIP family channel protein [Streptomyces sp. RPA4-5]|uniref:MIP family channel protein n=1 Tax=Streptomyces TaxID=1883 RepID=UPI00143E2947|nr:MULTISPECIES: MIP family channel protein [Streptomyces]MCX4638149.1 MIP family channel protein [Streptomyces platensis]QIY54632.1 MIP family channel protein [Streptomyces sp. RPA4-5]WJY37273.1 MIP family channel protein [Streptomyces sp. P9-2B-2]
MEKTEISSVLTRTVVSEFLGTLLLVFFAVGSAVLAGEYIGTFGIALAFGFTMVALAYALGPISGCHFNPAVTLGMLLARRITLRTAAEYWIAQVVGAIAGAALLFLVAKQIPGLQTHESFGTNGWGDRSAVHLNLGGAFVAEILMTFLLVYVWLSVTHKVAVIGFNGMAIGLALAAVHLIGVPLDGTGVNPARSIGPALFAGGAAITQLWLFIVAPLIGAAIAAVVHQITHPPHEPVLVADEPMPYEPADDGL